MGQKIILDPQLPQLLSILRGGDHVVVVVVVDVSFAVVSTLVGGFVLGCCFVIYFLVSFSGHMRMFLLTKLFISYFNIKPWALKA